VDDVHQLGRDRDAAAMLMIESDLPGVAADDELARAESVCVGVGATTTVRSQSPAEADMLRQARRAAHWALEKLGDVKMEDVGVPRSRVPDMLRAVESIAAVRRLPMATVNKLIADHTDGRFLGLFGEPGVNVLELNLALDGQAT